MNPKEACENAKRAKKVFEDNPDYLGKVMDRISKISECGGFGAIIQFQYVVEHAEYKKVETILEKMGYDVELYSDYLQVKWMIR